MMTTQISLILALSALVASTLSGMIGMGGGVILLGVMATLLPAAAVVPIHGVVQLGSNCTRTVLFIKHVNWRIFAYYVPFMILGVWGATLIWSGDKLKYFQPFIGGVILLYLLSRRYKLVWRNAPMLIYPIIGLLAGFVTIFIGATGPLIAPFFLRDDLDKEGVIATKAICQSVGHLLKIPAFLSLGFDYAAYGPLLATLLFMVIVGTMLGKRLLSKMNRQTFETAFLGILSLLALKLLFF